MKLLKQAGSFFSLLGHHLKGTNAPLFTALGVTNRCNFKCVYCYGDYYNQRQENFDTGQLLAIIDSLGKMGCSILNLIGGEPLIRDDIHVLVKRVKSLGMTCHISSNASLIPDKVEAIKGVDALDTSLDGLKENNDKNRGEGTFEKALAGLRVAIQNKIPSNVNMVLTRHNIGDVDEMIKLAVVEGFTISFNLVFESHSKLYKNYENSIALKSLEDSEIRNALKKIIKYKDNGYPIRFSKRAYEYAINWPVPFSEKVSLQKSELKSFKPIKCYYNRFHCYIDTDGMMYYCMHVKDKLPPVNVRELGVEEAWKIASSGRTGCSACYTICNNNANLIFSLHPCILFETFMDMQKK